MYISILSEFSLNVVNNVELTNFVQSSSSSIDYIVTRSAHANKVIRRDQIFEISTHDLIYLSYNCPVIFDKPKIYTYRDYKNVCLNNLFSDDYNTNWSAFYNATDVKDTAYFFKNIFYSSLDKNVPL